MSQAQKLQQKNVSKARTFLTYNGHLPASDPRQLMALNSVATHARNKAGTAAKSLPGGWQLISNISNRGYQAAGYKNSREENRDTIRFASLNSLDAAP